MRDGEDRTSNGILRSGGVEIVDFKLEVIVLPVSEVDRARNFYHKVGFRQDVDYIAPDGFRVVHFTPPGSATSLIIGEGVSDAAPGSVQGVHLSVGDVVAARAELVARGTPVACSTTPAPATG
ncbi:VOC family protein [Micromonospora sp. 050-3]|uniref:VOC family protein n=1 Tax=Micromonospora sp. 050-3 TaxID=2789265 RepID=UPI00397A5CFC